MQEAEKNLYLNNAILKIDILLQSLTVYKNEYCSFSEINNYIYIY